MTIANKAKIRYPRKKTTYAIIHKCLEKNDNYFLQRKDYRIPQGRPLPLGYVVKQFSDKNVQYSTHYYQQSD